MGDVGGGMHAPALRVNEHLDQTTACLSYKIISYIGQTQKSASFHQSSAGSKSSYWQVVS